MNIYHTIGQPEDYSDFVMPFGKYKGQTLDEIASSDQGLLWLDWAAGEIRGDVGDIIREYVNDLGQDIEEAIDRKRESYES